MMGMNRNLMRRAALILPVAGLFALWALAYGGREPPPERLYEQTMEPDLTENVAIAPRDRALTFARYREGDVLHLMLVENYADGMVTGSLLPGDDPITLFNAQGHDGVAAQAGPPVRVPATALVQPFDGTANQIAIGVNYPAHKAEADMEEPFLFPKLSRADAWAAAVPAGDGLLDYEVELGFVALTDLPVDRHPRTMGLVLAADYTDRALLLRRVNLLDPESGDGFTDAKSRPGYMPVGNLLVIPRDVRGFYADLRLQLFVEGGLRQVARPRDMVWQLDRMLAESRAKAEMSWAADGGPATLPIDNNGTIPARTIILSGTTDGVVFRPPGVRQTFIGVMETLFVPWHWSSWRDRLVARAIGEAQAGGHYLQPGQQVVMHADRLGVIHNKIVGASP
ncbi:fumarylacetoacetate hydrolase family protein [Niveispirillum sp. KHB5.9]|uniref:fumarylacetoacetate hydrolase family protein n=1 Tax=Niveispirillum sp. KHB5.9 TaxID=3400269 RepID=UPI003A8585C7